MSARFLVLYGTPRDVDSLERHYRDVHMPLARVLPGLHRYTLGRDVQMVPGCGRYHRVAELEWDDLAAFEGAYPVTHAYLRECVAGDPMLDDPQ